MAAGKKKAARLKAALVFLDESGFLMAPLVRRSWAPRGHTPVLRQRMRAQRKVSVIAALVVPPARDRLACYFRLHPDVNVDGARVIAFLRQLLRELKSPILLLWDRLQAHRSRVVQDFIAATPSLRTEWLPSYAPELNPVEPLWGYAKRNPLANCACPDLDRLTQTTRKAVRSIQRNPTLLRSFLQHSPLFLRLR